ncbi:type II toxin-antitoxin system PrlF family antitoxin [Skermanella mucosa]|uniref:AbrB/MazE/SpoVT family DNA-binding domain-containing protein n=1 Tax=Skermanella mucosa TaxID=1789672 RepID=UPI00192B368E|nr:type II toxin-antitoxin system PrlF family antitoxin [Skermanella mucosa]UEM22491.1 type II toxin-antitoxin system PrlF family antitoxin [Skermanella mucosa]
MITSKLSRKGKTTIPKRVRTALGLREGDRIVYNFEEDRVILRRAVSEQTDDPLHAFDEWNSEADRRAYAGL